MYSLAMIIIILFARTPKVDGAHLVARFPPALLKRKQSLPLLLPISLLCKQTINLLLSPPSLLLFPPSCSFLVGRPGGKLSHVVAAALPLMQHAGRRRRVSKEGGKRGIRFRKGFDITKVIGAASVCFSPSTVRARVCLDDFMCFLLLPGRLASPPSFLRYTTLSIDVLRRQIDRPSLCPISECPSRWG